MKLFVSGFLGSAYCTIELVVKVNDKMWQELKINLLKPISYYTYKPCLKFKNSAC